MPLKRPRYVPEIPLPPYTYVPGHTPHPVTDPHGHMFKTTEAPAPPPDPGNWRACPDYLRGLDLFNHGYYWEAHEAWERLWIAAGRTGGVADFLKGLIKLAAAGVKIREGNRAGVERHLARAAQLFQQASVQTEEPRAICFGLDARQLFNWATTGPPPDRTVPPVEVVAPVFDLVLAPE